MCQCVIQNVQSLRSYVISFGGVKLVVGHPVYQVLTESQKCILGVEIGAHFRLLGLEAVVRATAIAYCFLKKLTYILKIAPFLWAVHALQVNNFTKKLLKRIQKRTSF